MDLFQEKTGDLKKDQFFYDYLNKIWSKVLNKGQVESVFLIFQLKN